MERPRTEEKNYAKHTPSIAKNQFSTRVSSQEKELK